MKRYIHTSPPASAMEILLHSFNLITSVHATHTHTHTHMQGTHIHMHACTQIPEWPNILYII